MGKMLFGQMGFFFVAVVPQVATGIFSLTVAPLPTFIPLTSSVVTRPKPRPNKARLWQQLPDFVTSESSR